MIKEPEATIFMLKRNANQALEKGYQRYDEINGILVPHPRSKTKIKSDLLAPLLSQIVQDKSVIDIGCDRGYFSWLAKHHGASSVTCNEIFKNATDYLEVFCKMHDLKLLKGNLFNNRSYHQYQITMALAVVHQIGIPLENVIHRMRSITTEGSIIEFCEDYSEEYGSHWNLNWFKSIMLKYYTSLEVLFSYDAIGDYKGKRYVCHARCSD